FPRPPERYCRQSLLPCIFSVNGSHHGREVMKAVILRDRSDFPIGIKTDPWYVRTDIFLERSDQFDLFFLPKDNFSTSHTFEMQDEFRLPGSDLLLDLAG